MAFLRLMIVACCAALTTSDTASPGWIHYRPQAAPPHAISINSYRANLPAYYLLPPPPPVPVVPLPQAAPPLPLPQAVPAGPFVG